jgi:NAD(P)-dependent dehydrogenase (short-subunit alcohol dehydrogenase family)
MANGLGSKVAIVTGASKGIGRAIAVRLADEGVVVVAVARTAELLDALVAEVGVTAAGGRCIAHVADLADPDAPERLVATVTSNYGGVDILVNNAGAAKRGDFLELSDGDWADGFALKFFGGMRLTRAAWPHLAERKGAVVFIVGVGGRTGNAEFAIGGAVNAGLLNLTKVLADRGARDGVRVNAINPGWIETDRLKTRVARHMAEHGGDAEDAARSIVATMGIARFGQPEEIAAAVAFLAGSQASYVQGAVLDIDGGLTRTL